MYMIVGLGNPGKEYENSRHNVGFIAVDRLLEILIADNFESSGWKSEKLLKAQINILKKGEKKIILLKPLTFMNNSGIAVKAAIKKYQLNNISKELILIHDDLDIQLGKYKIQSEKSPKCHNGIKNVEDHLKTNKFARVRIGVDNRGEKEIPGEEYIIKSFSKDEKNILLKAIDSAEKELFLNLK